jgi:thiopeptide-type bacteriocin biosynthesis protein
LHAAVSHELLSDVAQAIDFLHRVTPFSESRDLVNFREAFRERYDKQEVALVEVLDEESGLGFPVTSGWLAGQPTNRATAFASHSESRAHLARDGYLLDKVVEAIKGRRECLELTLEDSRHLSVPEVLPLPTSFSVMVSVGKKSAASADEFALIRGVAGPSGGNLMGRFCHLSDELGVRVKQLLKREQADHPAVVFAEIVHVPEEHHGNILARPLLRDAEIEYLGVSGASRDRTIPITDLFVSIRNNRLVLRSRRLNCEVVPRLTTAHNFRKGLALYRFLCVLQSQGLTSGVKWHWGSLESCSFLPRVVLGRCVLSRARWRLSRQLHASIWSGSLHSRLASLRKWHQTNFVPRYCLMVEGDNELLVDFDDDLSVEVLAAEFAGREAVTLVELCPGPDELIVSDNRGSFTNELVIPFHRPLLRPDRQPSLSSRKSCQVRRTFVPGSEWFFVKIYGGSASLDLFLRKEVNDFLEQLAHKHRNLLWFFVKYADPHNHLRLRVRRVGSVHSSLLDEFSAVTSSAIDDGRLWRVQLDTYEREIERYGGDAGIELAEEVFWRDSEATLRILKACSQEYLRSHGWRVCLRSWDCLLSDFGFSIAERLRLSKLGASEIAGRLVLPRGRIRKVADDFRRERAAIREILSPHSSIAEPWPIVVDALRDRSIENVKLACKLRQSLSEGSIHVALESLVSSYLHMNANRLLALPTPEQEYVLYEYLRRHYESLVAQGIN